MSQPPYAQAGPYPPNTGPYPSNTGPYPSGPSEKGGPYPPNTGPYPPNTGPYPANTGPYPPNTGPYPANTGPYPQGQSEKGGPYATNEYPPNTHGTAPPYQGPAEGDDDDASFVMVPQPAPPSYENYMNQPGAFLAPPAYEAAPSAPPSVMANNKFLSEEDARSAFVDFVAQKCCYGSKPAKEARISKIIPTTAFHYRLETFAEKRSTDWAFVPYRGEPFVNNGMPPEPWSVMVPQPALFTNKTVKVEVPNTASVTPCQKCSGRGTQRCSRCWGQGRTRCTMCHGSGHRDTTHADGSHHHEHCHHCQGGYSRCFSCHGRGVVNCKICQGAGSLRHFIELTITWTNHKEDFVDEHTALPDELVCDVQGDILLLDENIRISPVYNFPIQAVNDAAARLMNNQMQATALERIIKQKQTLRGVPCYECEYIWDNKSYHYFVYGNEHKVHVSDYPQSCCWGCSIL